MLTDGLTLCEVQKKTVLLQVNINPKRISNEKEFIILCYAVGSPTCERAKFLYPGRR